jgi:hypothetical protein
MLDARIGSAVHKNPNYFLEQAGGVRLEAGGGRCAGEQESRRAGERRAGEQER